MNTATVKPWTRLPDYNNAADMSTAQLAFDGDTCRKCTICSSICPARTIDRDTSPMAWNGGLPFLKTSAPGVTNCVACGCCLAACPASAISITRNFAPGDYYMRLTQTRELAWPKKFLPNGQNHGGGSQTASGEPAAEEAVPRVSLKRALKQKINLLLWAKRGIAGGVSLLNHERKQGRTLKTMAKFLLGRTFDISWARLLEESAARVPDKRCLLYNDERFSYREMDENANRLGHYLTSLGLSDGEGLGIIMRNSPRFLDAFFGTQKIGMYSVPVNPELKGDGLTYILNHSCISSVLVDAELLSNLLENLDRFDRINLENIIVNDVEEEAKGFEIPDGCRRLSEAYDHSRENPGVMPDPEDICLIIYTSGTTGRPKGVVYRYNNTGVLLYSLAGRVFFNKKDVYYTYLSLCHGNALFITVSMSMAVTCTIALSRKFSASRFWDTVRKHKATVFNTIGSIIPILMKQPERPDDRNNTVRAVMSAACPLDMWEPFETRFGLEIYEAYGAIDGGGKNIMNLGTAPPGSLGKPPKPGSIRIVDEHGRDVPDLVPGELLFAIKGEGSPVEYFKNPEATQKKSKGGWLHTGDIVKRDKKGYIYFVGRNTESMRKGGENVSAYEVEHVIMQHEQVEDVAVYAVPSELGEDEIMAAVKTVGGVALSPVELRSFLSDKLARYAVPRYLRFVDEFPKTNSHRIIKRSLEDQGVTDDTFDALNM